jgi:hypothetical protein
MDQLLNPKEVEDVEEGVVVVVGEEEDAEESQVVRILLETVTKQRMEEVIGAVA